MATILLDGREVQLPSGLATAMATVPAPLTVRYVPVAVARQRLETAGKWDALVGALSMPLLIKIATLQQGLNPTDPEVRAAITAAGADPEAILAL